MPIYDQIFDIGEQDDEDRRYRRSYCNPANHRRLLLDSMFADAEYKRQTGFSKTHFERQDGNCVELWCFFFF